MSRNYDHLACAKNIYTHGKEERGARMQQECTSGGRYFSYVAFSLFLSMSAIHYAFVHVRGLRA